VESIHFVWKLEPGESGSTSGVLSLHGSDISRIKRDSFVDIDFSMQKGGEAVLDLDSIRWDAGTQGRYDGVIENLIAFAFYMAKEKGADSFVLRDQQGWYEDVVKSLNIEESVPGGYRISRLQEVEELSWWGVFMHRLTFQEDMVDLINSRFAVSESLKTYLLEQGYLKPEDLANQDEPDSDRNELRVQKMHELFGHFQTEKTVLKVLEDFGFFDGETQVRDDGTIPFKLGDKGRNFIETLYEGRLGGRSLNLLDRGQLVTRKVGDPAPVPWDQLSDVTLMNYSGPNTDGEYRLPLFIVLEDATFLSLIYVNLAELLFHAEIEPGDAFALREDVSALENQYGQTYMDTYGFEQMPFFDLDFKRFFWEQNWITRVNGGPLKNAPSLHCR